MKQKGYIDGEFLFGTGGLILGFALVGGLLFGAYKMDQREKREWKSFSATHACKVVGRMAGNVSVGNTFTPRGDGSTSVGIMVNTTPDKTGWQCNDGVTYWRNE